MIEGLEYPIPARVTFAYNMNPCGVEGKEGEYPNMVQYSCCVDDGSEPGIHNVWPMFHVTMGLSDDEVRVISLVKFRSDYHIPMQNALKAHVLKKGYAFVDVRATAKTGIFESDVPQWVRRMVLEAERKEPTNDDYQI